MLAEVDRVELAIDAVLDDFAFLATELQRRGEACGWCIGHHHI